MGSLFVGVGDMSDAQFGDTILQLRQYRCILAALTGAALAVAGVLSQGLFRNPLAAPSVIGVSSGAALGGQLGVWLAGCFVLPLWMSAEMLVPFAALLGAIAALSVLLLCLRGSRDSIHTVLLVGVILSGLLASIGALIVSLSQNEWELGRAVVAFTLGGLDGKSVQHIYLAAPLIIGGIYMAYTWAPELNILLSGEEEAQALGLNVKHARLWILLWIAVLCAAAVAVGGGVAFVGLIIPNLLRSACRSDHRLLIPVAAIAGAAFVIICDIATRSLPSVGVLPLGVITGCVGAPVFLWILIRYQRGVHS
ncbi:MAG: iron ABC transporter permease [Planctomycetes bacterium]|nr:iron ABC transporter permease [Planctomycetota bacterium]